MRILPYLTAKNTIDGLVLTFVDISKMKEAEQVILASRRFADSIVETVREPLLVLDDHLRVVTANPAFYATFQVTPREVEQQQSRLAFSLGGGPVEGQLVQGLRPGQDLSSDRSQGVGAQWAPARSRRSTIKSNLVGDGGAEAARGHHQRSESDSNKSLT